MQVRLKCPVCLNSVNIGYIGTGILLTTQKTAVGIGSLSYTYGKITFTYGFLLSLKVKFLVVPHFSLLFHH